jgi:hypothetical protein
MYGFGWRKGENYFRIIRKIRALVLKDKKKCPESHVWA